MLDKKKFFTHQLLRWNKVDNSRLMPWKGEKDPYKIWLSEIILQQTRVEQGWEYYTRFVTAFPTIKKLANASETKIFKLWEGLGYYNRCKNLITTAKFIAIDLNGNFPDNYNAIMQLKGVGPYTAAAIASFAFNLPHAVVDANVFRVLARFFNVKTPIDSAKGKAFFTQLANELLDKKNAGIYNQALMDFGAIICKPKLPLCMQCLLQTNCGALKNNIVHKLPVKQKKLIAKARWFNYLVLEHNDTVLVQKRYTKDIWENLYQFYLIETSAATTFKKIKMLDAYKNIFGKKNNMSATVSKLFVQKLTHQTIYGQFIKITVKNNLAINGFKNVSKKQLATLPLPKLILSYLKDKNVSLNL